MLNVENVLDKLHSLKNFPDIDILHKGIDQRVEGCGLERKNSFATFPDKKYDRVAGGIVRQQKHCSKADILIVGRYVRSQRH
jgi:3-keto-L-gulonate-6-phosphate decarboxylase